MSNRRDTKLVRHFRINFRILITLAVLAVVVGSGIYFTKEGEKERMSRETIAAATALYKGENFDLAIRHLSQHLNAWPADADALELKARILYELATRSANSADQIYEAARVNEQLLRLAPEAAYSQDARRHLIELDVVYSDIMRNTQISNQFMDELYARNVRYRAAEEVARQLIARGGVKPGDYLLWAKALDGMAVPGATEALAGAIEQYRNVLTMIPDSVDAAERLSKIYQGRMKDPERAEQVLDDLIKAAPKSVPARLARHKLYVKLHLNDKAAGELEEASRLEPTPEELRDLMISSAEFLLRKGETTAARDQLARIPPEFKDDVRAVMVKGLIDFEEEQPDEAIEAWRNGLQVAMGTDADLTWWLAYALLQMNRAKDADPLLYQYVRLNGGNDPKARFLQSIFFEKTGRPSRALAILESIHQHVDPRFHGMIALARGRCAEALWDEVRAKDAYSKVLEIDPNSIVARLALAKLKLKRNPEDAISEIERGLKIDPENPALRTALVGARLRLEAGKAAGDRSWVVFDRDWHAAADKKSSGNSALALMWADRLSLAGREDEAVKFLENAAAGSEKSVAVVVALANGYNRLGKPKLAEAVLDRAKESNSDQASLRIARAVTLTALFRGREARDALTKDIKKIPDAEKFQLWMAAGQFDADRGDLKAAGEDYEKAASIGLGDPRPFLVLLELELANGNRDQIRNWVNTLYQFAGKLSGPKGEAARQAAKADLSYMIARAKELLWLTKDSELSVALVDDVELDELDANQIELKRIEVLRDIAKSEKLIRDKKRAEVDTEKTEINRIPDDETRKMKLALLPTEDEIEKEITKLIEADEAKKLADSKARKLEKAAKLIDSIVFEAPQLPASQMLRAGVLELQGDLDNAIAAYMKVWERGNEVALPKIIALLGQRRRYDTITQLRQNPAASKSQVDLFSAQLFLSVGDRTQAGRIAEQLALDLHGSGDALGWKAKMLNHLGRIDDAETVLRALAERQPNVPEPWLNLVEFQATRNRKQALQETIVRARAAIKTDRPETLDARIAAAAGDHVGAANAFANAAAKYSADIPTRLEAARFHENKGEFGKAETYLREAAKLAPDDRRVVRMLAEVLARRATLSDDAKLWEEAWSNLGTKKDEKEAGPEDRYAWATVLHYAPDIVPNQVIKGLAVAAADKPRDQAIKLLDNLKRDLPLNQSGNVRKTLASWFMEERNRTNKNEQENGSKASKDEIAQKSKDESERAEEAIQPIAAAGTDPTAIALYAQILIQSKKIEAAEWQLDRLAALSPGDPREASLRARLILNRAKPVEAAQALEQAYTNREDDPGSEALGREAFTLLSHQSNPRDPSLQRLAERLANKNPACSWMPAQIQARRGRNDEAFTYLKTAAKSAARFDDLFQTGTVAVTIATNSSDKVTTKKVEEILKSILATQPDVDVFNIMMAMLKHIQGDYEEEVRLYKKALERRPEDYTCLNNLAWALCEGLKRPDAARTYADKMVKLFYEDPDVKKKDVLVLDTRGVIFTRLRLYDKAIDDLKALVKEKPAPVHLLHLARAYRLSGNLDEARKLEDRARSIGIPPQDIDPADRNEILGMLKP